MKGFSLIFILLFITAPGLYADDTIDDLMEGFGSSEPVKIESDNEKKDSDFDFTTGLSLYSSYGINSDAPVVGKADWQGFNSLRAKLDQDMEYRPNSRFDLFLSGSISQDLIFEAKERSDYSDSLLEDREFEAEVESSYILLTPFSNIDIKAGRQIIVWGKSDNIRITDILNPMDKREPGLTDIEDLRLSQAMTKIDLYRENLNFSFIFVHENREDKLPCYNSPFYIFPYEIQKPDIHDGDDNTGFAFAFNGVFTGWDLSLYGAKVYDHDPYLENGSLNRDFIKMLGYSVNFAVNNWVLKSEGAVFTDKKYTNEKDEKTRGDILLGAEYSGFDDTTISFEIANRHIFDYEDSIKKYSDIHEDELEQVLRINRTFVNERLDLTYLAYLYRQWGDGGAVQRIESSWEQTDRLTLRCGFGFYNGGSMDRLNKIRSNDRVFAEIKYVF